MARHVLPLALAAAAALGACTSYDPDYRSTAPAVTAPNAVTTAPGAVAGPVVATAPGYVVVAPNGRALPFRPGWGVVESVAIIRPVPVTSASAGASGQVYRIGVRMDDGVVQTFDVDRNMSIGDRVELTQDGRVVRN